MRDGTSTGTAARCAMGDTEQARAGSGENRTPTRHNAAIRAAWEACHADGLTAPEAAERMGASKNTAFCAARRYGFRWKPTGDKGGRPIKKDTPPPVDLVPLPKVARKAKPRDPLRGGVVLSLRGGAATYAMQIASALASSPAGTRLIYCRARADECGPAKAAAAKVAASTGGTMTQWPIGTGEGRLWAYSIARAHSPETPTHRAGFRSEEGAR